jgi:RNA polymerase sigma factor
MLDPSILLNRAKAGDKRARNDLIDAFKPFVLKVAARISGRYLHVGEDEEVSVGLIAFDEAIDAYDPERGTAFLSFAETVIRRRLIDYFRKTARTRRREIPLSELESTEEEGETDARMSRAEARLAAENFQRTVETQERKREIGRYSELLQSFDLNFKELVDIAPRRRDARERARKVARVIAETPRYRKHLLERHTLPQKWLDQDERLGLSRKTMERQRKYIIAIALLLIHDFEQLRNYINE